MEGSIVSYPIQSQVNDTHPQDNLHQPQDDPHLPQDAQGNSLQPHYIIPEDVSAILRVRQTVVLPVFIVLGLASNIFCIIVTRRPKLRELNINRYLQCMILSDMCTNFAYFPHILFYADTCSLRSYAQAFYKAHLRSPPFYYTKFFTTYILVSLSFDRFTIIWYGTVYDKLKNNVTKRLFIIWAWLTISILPSGFLGEVWLDSNGLWHGVSGFRNTKNPWFSLYMNYTFYFMVILPSVFLIFLSIGLVVGFIKKGLAKSKTRKFRNTIAVLVLNCIYIAIVMTYHIVVYIQPPKMGDCSYDSKRIIMTVLCESLMLVWSIVNTLIFFVISKDYRAEAKAVLPEICHTRGKLIYD
ncbi:unnamed protein product, partial [Meganyctiphanes norvegica]